jgi:hypothetical protein
MPDYPGDMASRKKTKADVMKSLYWFRIWAAAAVLTGITLNSQAADDTTIASPEKSYVPWEKGGIKIGGFIAAFNSDLGFGVNNAAGVTINAEELLGLDSSLTVFRAEAMFRPGASRRHQLDFSYSSYDREASKTISEDIIINDTTIPAGTQIESVFDFDIIRGTYSYAILQDDRMRIALGLGIYAVPVKYGLDYETTGGKTVVHGGDTTLPLPSVALRAEFQLVPKLFLGASLDAMYLEISDFKGSLLDVNVGLEYRPWKHFGFGLGYNAMSVFVEVEDTSSNYPGADFVGTVDVRFSGLLMYGKFSF